MRGPAWIVLPTYCEADNVAPMVAALRAAAPAGTRILIVDDASPDGTGAAADRLAAADPHVAVLHRTAKRGLGPAYVAGFAHALAGGAGALIEIDCDFSHDPALVPVLLGAVRDGADLALGSRYVAGGGIEGWAAWRRAVSRAGNGYARRVLRVPVRDLTGGLKCFRAEALEAIAYGPRGRAATRSRSSSPTACCAPACASWSCRSRSASGARARPSSPATWRSRRRGGSRRCGCARRRESGPCGSPPSLEVRGRAADARGMRSSTEQLALVRGWDDTVSTLQRWRRRPFAAIGPWVAASLGVAVVLLLATWVVAVATTPDPMNFARTGTGRPRRLRLHPLPQRPGPRAARDGLRRRVHGRLVAARRRRGLPRPVAPAPRSRRPPRDGCSSPPPRCSRSPRRPTRSGSRPPTRPTRAACRPASCSSASRSTPSPSCARCSSRWPPG